MSPEELEDQIDILSDLRKPVSYERFATPKQLTKLNIALTEIVGNVFRIAVLRMALGYGETFRSTRQLYFSDAHGLIEWLWDKDDSRTDDPSKILAIQALRELKFRFLKESYVETVVE